MTTAVAKVQLTIQDKGIAGGALMNESRVKRGSSMISKSTSDDEETTHV